MILSFALTKDQFTSGAKRATRRNWKPRTFEIWRKAYDEGRRVHDAWDKSPHRGGKKIGQIEMTKRPYKQALWDMQERDLILEGFPRMTKTDFYELVGLQGKDEVTVVEFEPIIDLPQPEVWHGLFGYGSSMESLITKTAVRHPAKMTRLMLLRIYQELAEYGITSGRVFDPFGGIGSTAVVGAMLGYNVVVTEIERMFWRMMVGHECTSDDLCPTCLLDGRLPLLDRHHFQGNRDLLPPSGQARFVAHHADARAIGELEERPFDALITSTPYEDLINGKGDGPNKRRDFENHNPETATNTSATNLYGDEEGQIGMLKGEPYWEAMDQVFAAAAERLKPNGLAFVNVKNYVRDSTEVPFHAHTISSLRRAGLRLERIIHASLVEETSEVQPSLWLGMKPKRRKKIHESQPRRVMRKRLGWGIDWEYILIAKKESNNK